MPEAEGDPPDMCESSDDEDDPKKSNYDPLVAILTLTRAS